LTNIFVERVIEHDDVAGPGSPTVDELVHDQAIVILDVGAMLSPSTRAT
jgi:hypothetical protein